MQFGEHLSKLIHQKGHSVRSFAAVWRPDNPESGRRNLYRYISLNQEPTARVASDLADALGVTVDELLGESEQDDEEQSFLAAVAQLQETAAMLASVAKRIEKRKRSAA